MHVEVFVDAADPSIVIPIDKSSDASSENESYRNSETESSSSGSSSSNGDNRSNPPPMLRRRVVPTADLSTLFAETSTSAIAFADSLLIHYSGLAGLFVDPVDTKTILVTDP